jgi:pimeloyl-ACP methyl ester carboxylesterase
MKAPDTRAVHEAEEFYADFRKKHPYKRFAYKDKEWNYIISGSNAQKAIVLLHGGGFDAGMWAYQICELEKKYTVIAPSFSLVNDSFRLRAEALNQIFQREGLGNMHMQIQHAHADTA